MDGYDFITAVDGKTWGKVVGEQDDYVIVEHGTLRKHRYAVPSSSVEVDEAENEARTSLSGDLISESPTVDDGLDREEVARHYGLVDTSQAGIDTAVEERARAREGSSDVTDAMPDESPALLGDRLSDVRDEER